MQMGHLGKLVVWGIGLLSGLSGLVDKNIKADNRQKRKAGAAAARGRGRAWARQNPPAEGFRARDNDSHRRGRAWAQQSRPADGFRGLDDVELADLSAVPARKGLLSPSPVVGPRGARAEDFRRPGNDPYVLGFLPFIGYHHVLMLLIAVSVILLSFLLAGCSSSSPGIDSIFLISLYYQNYVPYMDPSQVDTTVYSNIANLVGRAQLEVRVGYFGICVSPNGGGFLCSNNASALAQQVSNEQDPLNLIFVANTFKNSIVFPYLLIIAIIFAFVCFLLLATFPGWHEETDDDNETRDVKPFPSRPVSQVALALIFVASIFVLVSVLWQHTASISASQVAQDLGNGSILSGVGTSALALGWISFALLILVTIGLLAMILSIRVLSGALAEDLVDDDE